MKKLSGNGKVRKLSPAELEAVLKMGARLGSAGDPVAQDAAAGEVESINEDDSILIFLGRADREGVLKSLWHR